MKTMKELHREIEKLYPGRFNTDPRHKFTWCITESRNKPINYKWNIEPTAEGYVAISDNKNDPSISADTLKKLITKIQLLDHEN